MDSPRPQEEVDEEEEKVASDAHIDYEEYVKHIDPESAWPEYRSPIDRAYSRYYTIDGRGKGPTFDDMYVHQHPNGLCIVGLAPSHPIVFRKLSVNEFKFLQTTQFSGKHKRGAFHSQFETILAQATCGDGSVHKFRANVRGFVVELNQRLVTEPSLLATRPEDDGFVAIIQPPRTAQSLATTPLIMTREVYERERLQSM